DHSAKALDQLPVLQTRSGSVPPYSRDEFGQRWADIDHNGCDTRNDILRRDLHSLQMKTSSPNCVVVGGILDDPYTGRTIEFHKGEESSDQVQIDHVVALANAWRSGAWQWDATRRQEFANDPANLLAVDGNANQDKGASRADQWLPPNSRYRCAYVQRQIVVKSSWGLGVTPREKKAMKAVLDHCE
ncbi:MAG: HNH endonuclease family protein, partial [Negativicoccus succinicivorans]|nr:HNH endonuclease family protein [Negativicoccus succinicivorans]